MNTILVDQAFKYKYFMFLYLVASGLYQLTEVVKNKVGVASRSLSHEEANEIAERLIDDYGNNVLRVAYSYLHNKVDAEDILQETLIQFLRTRPILTSPTHEKAWLIRVASNLSKNKIKYNKLRKTDELSEELIEAKREDLSYVWEVIKKLPEKYRECIHLYYHEGYNTVQIANTLGRKESSIRSNLHRGREQLKLLLKEEYDFE